MIEIATGRELKSFSLGGEGMIASVEFDPSGRFIVASGPGSTFNAIKIGTGEVTQISPDIGWVAEYKFSPDGRLMAATSRRGIILWETRSWKEVRRIGGESNAGDRGHVVFTRDGRYLAAIAKTGQMHFWEASTGAEVCAVGEGLSHAGPIEFTADGRVLAAGADGTVRVFGPRAAPAAKAPPGGKR